MGKTQKFSKGSAFGTLPHYGHAVEIVGESDYVGSPTRIESQDSYAPKRKCVSLNNGKRTHFEVHNVPREFFSVTQLSESKRKKLELRLRRELKEIQSFEKLLVSSGVPGSNEVHVINVGDVHMKEQAEHLTSKLKRSDSAQSLKREPSMVHPGLARTYSMVMKQCEALLKRVMSQQFAWVFNAPVDVVSLNIPDYYDIIKQPMDLGTISRKIKSYSNPRDFAADVRLTFSNAMTYNPRGNNVHMWADSLRKYFEQRWKPIEKKLSEAELAFAEVGAEESIVLPKLKARPEPKFETKPVMQPKKREISPYPHDIPQQHIAKRVMTEEQKVRLSQRLGLLARDMPQNIVDFLRAHTINDGQADEEEFEIDIDSLGDDTLFELEKILDDCTGLKVQQNQQKHERDTIEIFNVSGLSHSSMQQEKGIDVVEEDVDICGNDPPVSNFPSSPIEKDIYHGSRKQSSSTSSSSESESSSSGSDSSSSNSDSEAKGGISSSRDVKEVQSGIIVNQTRGETAGLRHRVENNGPLYVEVDSQKEENAPSEKQLSPGKQYRAALLRGRFADTILKAREKTIDQVAKSDPDKGRREKEELERLQREERARLQAEARAAEDAQKRVQEAAAAEAKLKRELDREAQRRALQQMEKTVEINEGTKFLEDLEILRTAPGEHLPSSVGETSPISPDGLSSFRPGSNPLEQLGLYMKVDDEEEEGEPSNSQAKDVEDGEID